MQTILLSRPVQEAVCGKYLKRDRFLAWNPPLDFPALRGICECAIFWALAGYMSRYEFASMRLSEALPTMSLGFVCACTELFDLTTMGMLSYTHQSDVDGTDRKSPSFSWPSPFQALWKILDCESCMDRVKPFLPRTASRPSSLCLLLDCSLIHGEVEYTASLVVTI